MKRSHLKNLEHLSPEWFKAREGRFTSSRAHELLSDGRSKNSIGQMFYSYVYESTENELFGEEDSFSNADTERGNELEPLAFSEYQRRMAREFISVEKSGFFTIGEHEGSSPDGLIGEDAVLEIKAPRRRKFFDIVRHGIHAIDKSWLIQVQHQMRVTGRNKAVLLFIFVTDDGRALLHDIDIKIDHDIQRKLTERLKLAIEEKEQYRQYLIEKYFNE